MMENQQEIATPDTKDTPTRKVRSQQLEFGTTKWLTYAAVFSALAIVIKFIGQFLTLTPSFKITLIYVIWLISGATLGAFGGGAVCFTSDVLGAIIFPTGAMNPYLILGNTLYGIIAALAFKYTPIKNYCVKMISAGIACTVICTCLINTLALYYSYGYDAMFTFAQYFVAYRILQPLVAVINIVIAVAMIPLMLRLKMLPPIKKKIRTIKTEELLCQTSR